MYRSKKVQLAAIYVEYSIEKYKNSFKILRSLLEKQIGKDINFIVVNNSKEDEVPENISQNIIRISGNNCDREFSGWQKGLEYLQSTSINYDAVLFCNESFQAYNDTYLSNYALMALNRCLLKKAIVGYFDKEKQRKIYRLLDYKFYRWLRTSAFFIPKEFLSGIRILSVDDTLLNRFLPEKFEQLNEKNLKDYFYPDAPINQEFKEKIVDWITSKWHSSIEINKENWELFRSKVKSIFNEALLTIQAETLGSPAEWYASYPIVVYEKIKNKLKNNG